MTDIAAYKHTFEPVFSKLVKYISLAIGAGGIVIVCCESLWGMAFIIIPLVVIFIKEFSVIDFKAKRVKVYYSLFGIRLGRWKTLDGVTHIYIKRKRVYYANYPNDFLLSGFGAVTYDRAIDYGIYLVKGKSDRILVSNFNNPYLAKSTAEMLGEKLNLRVIDGPQVDPKIVKGRRR